MPDNTLIMIDSFVSQNSHLQSMDRGWQHYPLNYALQSTRKRNYVTAFCFPFVLVRTKSAELSLGNKKLPF